MIRPLCKFDHPILRAKCETVDPTLPDSIGIGSILQDMRDSCHGQPVKGVGLAAPQIGIPLRIIYICPTGKLEDYHYWVINPEIVSKSESMALGEEGCLSYPEVTAQVNRYERIEVSGIVVDQHTRPAGLNRTLTLHRWDARIVQHEIDHLDGICHVGVEWKRGRQ